MSTAATHPAQSTANRSVVYVTIELSKREWQLAATDGAGRPIRRAAVRAGVPEALADTLLALKQRLGLPADAAVRSCYEAGREGFWPHRLLTALGVAHTVIDSSSIEVNRRARRAKSDRLDATHLLRLLLRVAGGERGVWHEVHVPSDAEEDARHAGRCLSTLVAERTRYRNRLHSLLATQGVPLRLDAQFPARLAAARRPGDGAALPAGLHERLLTMWRMLRPVETERRALERTMQQAMRTARTEAAARVARLARLRGVAWRGASALVHEVCQRDVRNRRQVGALTGLVPVPYQSGARQLDQGVSRAGLREIRRLAVEMAWMWVRWQPESPLTVWFHERFGGSGRRARRVGIVAVARKLMIELWRYAMTGEPPAHARLVRRAA